MDAISSMLNDIICGSLPFEHTMLRLQEIEPHIEQQYLLGNTGVKPVSLITVDDLLTL